MRGYRALAPLVAGLMLAGCTSDPNAPVNQTFPIRQMDHFFESLSPPPGDTPPAVISPTVIPPTDRAYTHVPGYAPAYPPYE